MNVHPFIIRLGPVEITGFGIMLVAAFMVGSWIIGLELGRRRLNPNYAGDIIVAAVVGGIVGAKLWYVALYRDPGALLSRGGLVWYGGLLGGALAVILNGWRLRVPIRWTMHLTAPGLALAYAVGRIGCFLVGDDYGRPTDVPWAVRFPEGLPPSTAGNLKALFGVPVPEGIDPSTVMAVHPTQLYETAIMALAFAVIWPMRKWEKPIGWLFGVYLVLAGIERFLVEILRAKDDRFLGPFTLAQATSAMLVAVGVAIIVGWANGKGPEPGPYLAQAAPAERRKAA